MIYILKHKESKMGNEHRLSPLTETQAVSVARDTLHTLVHASEIGRGCVENMVREAQEDGSDIRLAIEFLDKIHSVMLDRERSDRQCRRNEKRQKQVWDSMTRMDPSLLDEATDD